MRSIPGYCFLIMVCIPQCTTGDLNEFNKNFRILPQLQKIELLSGEGLFYKDIQGIFLQNTDNKPVLSGLLSGFPSTAVQTEGTISLITRQDLALPSPEGYILEIKSKQVIITAETQAGLFYGIQTLIQLLEDSRDHNIEIKIPALRITDYPEIDCRAIHLDLKHHLANGTNNTDWMYVYEIAMNKKILEWLSKQGI